MWKEPVGEVCVLQGHQIGVQVVHFRASLLCHVVQPDISLMGPISRPQVPSVMGSTTYRDRPRLEIDKSAGQQDRRVNLGVVCVAWTIVTRR